MALLSTTVRNNWWCICHFSLQRDFANVKGICILEANYNRTGHIIYIRILNQIQSIVAISQQLVVVIKCHA